VGGTLARGGADGLCALGSGATNEGVLRGLAARYGRFAGTVEEAMKVETATRFLTALVDDEECAY